MWPFYLIMQTQCKETKVWHANVGNPKNFFQKEFKEFDDFKSEIYNIVDIQMVCGPQNQVFFLCHDRDLDYDLYCIRLTGDNKLDI